MIENQISIERIFQALSKSSFRSRFHLTQKEKEYIRVKGLDKIQEHAYDFVRKRLASADIANDGKQTPMRGHPVFLAQHATATCCRGCLYKWHKIPMNCDLSEKQIDYIVFVIMKWIRKQYK